MCCTCKVAFFLLIRPIFVFYRSPALPSLLSITRFYISFEQTINIVDSLALSPGLTYVLNPSGGGEKIESELFDRIGHLFTTKTKIHFVVVVVVFSYLNLVINPHFAQERKTLKNCSGSSEVKSSCGNSEFTQ